MIRKTSRGKSVSTPNIGKIGIYSQGIGWVSVNGNY